MRERIRPSRLVVLTLCLAFSFAAEAQARPMSITVMPENPRPGQAVTLSFHHKTPRETCGLKLTGWTHVWTVRASHARFIWTSAQTVHVRYHCGHRVARLTFHVTNPARPTAPTNPTVPMAPTRPTNPTAPMAPTAGGGGAAPLHAPSVSAPIFSPSGLYPDLSTVANACGRDTGLGIMRVGYDDRGQAFVGYYLRSDATQSHPFVFGISTDGDDLIDLVAQIAWTGSTPTVTDIARCGYGDWAHIATVVSNYQSNPADPAFVAAESAVAGEIGGMESVTPDGPGCAGFASLTVTGAQCTVQDTSSTGLR